LHKLRHRLAKWQSKSESTYQQLLFEARDAPMKELRGHDAYPLELLIVIDGSNQLKLGANSCYVIATSRKIPLVR